MDYGRLAYMKAEEIEERMNAPVSGGEGGAYCTQYPKFNFKSGDYTLGELTANGQVTLILKLAVRRNRDMEVGSLLLKVAGMSASRQEVAGVRGESAYVMLANVFVSGVTSVTISPSAGLDATLLSIEAAAIGGGCKLGGGLTVCSADYCETTSAAAISKDMQIYVSGISDGVLGGLRSAGRGGILDLAGAGEGFSLVFCDDCFNMWGVRYNSAAVETSRRYIGLASESVAVTEHGGRLLLAQLTGGKVISHVCDYDFGGMCERSELDVGLKADDVKFVKHAVVPMLAVSANGCVYVKLAAKETRALGVFRFKTLVKCE